MGSQLQPRTREAQVYFNQRFGVSAIAMRRLGAFNPKIDVDNNMFVDPKLLDIGKEEFKGAHNELVAYFGQVVKLVKLIKTRTDTDLAWGAAWRKMRFRETANTALGFSKEGTNGNGIGTVLAQRIVTRASEILPQVDFDVADLNEEAPAEVNRIYADAQKRRVSPKPYLRSAAIRNASITRGIISGYKKAPPVPYDYDRDPNNVAKLDPIAREIVGDPSPNVAGLSQMERVEACVDETIRQLRKGIEQNRLSDVLYDDDLVPRNEVVSQRLIYAVADIFAKIYDVDLSREGNAGPGSVDFRFTVGYKARLLVEVKLSTHTRIKEGYYEQLPAYAKAEDVKRLILLVVRVSSDDSNIDRLINSIKKKSLPIQIEVIDAVPKPPASKRRYIGTS